MPKIKLSKEKKKDRKEFECEDGAVLRDALLANGYEAHEGINQKLNCGGKGRCATCRVIVKKGSENLSPPGFMERMRIKLAWFSISDDEYRLSCQAKVHGDIHIEERPEFPMYGVENKPRNARAGNVDEIPV